MGNETSSLVDESMPPVTLRERSLDAVAELILEGGVKRIVVMTGAGISTAAGIPDFRSPKTGLYWNLARLNLPYAEAVFDMTYFRQKPEPFYVLAKELYPGKFHPTITHAFIALLAKKGLLEMLFTQNIDCLERAAGVPPEKIIEAHGTFATQRCIECKTPFPDDFMREYVQSGTVPRCLEKGCEGLVKPDIVFFGEGLPERFHRNIDIPSRAELALVLGTSLTVMPFARLPQLVSAGTPRVLFNLEQAGDLGSRADDVLELGSCDDGVRKLAAKLGWKTELETLWRSVVGNEEAERQLRVEAKEETREDDLESEVTKLTEGVASALKISGEDEARAADQKEEGFVSRMSRIMESEISSQIASRQEDGVKDDAVSKQGKEASREETTKVDPKEDVSGDSAVGKYQDEESTVRATKELEDEKSAAAPLAPTKEARDVEDPPGKSQARETIDGPSLPGTKAAL